jgi:RHS repeat-associated protein
VAIQPLRFAGQYADGETGLYYNRHRFYDPETGRYTTLDPIGINGGRNLYAYSVRPLSEIDPLGLNTEVVKHKCPLKNNPANQRQNPTDTQPQRCSPSRGTSIHNHCINKLREMAKNQKYETRADQSMQSKAYRRPPGNNRPDLHITTPTGENVYVEWDYDPASRAEGHKNDICAAHPGAIVLLVKIPQTTRFERNKLGRKPRRRGTIQRSSGPSNKDCGIDKIKKELQPEGVTL